jgi:hypothetical protein
MVDDLTDATAVRKALASLSSRRGWNPPRLGTMDMEIRADGSWWHEGSEITRSGLVKLFASILRQRNGKYELATPVECWEIRVQDSAFVVRDWHWDKTGEYPVMIVTTNTGESCLLEDPRGFRVTLSASGEPRPYVLVRDGLEARVPPATYYQWLEEATLENTEEGVRAILMSAGACFCLGEASDSDL